MLATVRDHQTYYLYSYYITLTYTYIIHYHMQSYHATIFYNNKKQKQKKELKNGCKTIE